MLTFALSLLLSIPLPAKPERYVTDHAGVIPMERASALNEKLAEFERATSNQILVYVDRNLPGDTTIEEMASEAMRQWGVGQKGKDNGVAFFVFIDAREMRIEVGYGLEGAIPDARAKRILGEIVKPKFKAGDYAGGVEDGVDAILAAARGEPYQGTGQTVAEARSTAGSTQIVIVMALVMLAFFSIFVWLLLRLRKFAWSRGGGSSSSWSSDSSSSSSSSSSDWSSSSSSSSSSSDFSGGGGSSGGGGASDKW